MRLRSPERRPALASHPWAQKGVLGSVLIRLFRAFRGVLRGAVGMLGLAREGRERCAEKCCRLFQAFTVLWARWASHARAEERDTEFAAAARGPQVEARVPSVGGLVNLAESFTGFKIRVPPN